MVSDDELTELYEEDEGEEEEGHLEVERVKVFIEEGILFKGIVKDEASVDALVLEGYRLWPIRTESGVKWILVKKYKGSYIEVYLVDGEAENYVKSLNFVAGSGTIKYVYNDIIRRMVLALNLDEVTYLETGYMFMGYIILSNCVSDLRRYLLDYMLPSEKERFFKYTSDPFRREEAKDKYQHTYYRLRSIGAERAREILKFIISYVSSLGTPSAINASVIAHTLLNMIKYDPTYGYQLYETCLNKCMGKGGSKEECMNKCEKYLNVGEWYVEVPSKHYAVDVVNDLLNDLEANIARAIGEAGWEDKLTYNEVVIWLYRNECPKCQAIMKAREFEELQKKLITFGIPFFMVNADEPVSKTTVYHYLAVKSMLLKPLETPILVYYNLPAKKMIIWSSGRDYEFLPVPEHLDGLFFVFYDEKGNEKPGASDYIIRQLTEITMPIIEKVAHGKKKDIIAKTIIDLLKRNAGRMNKTRLVKEVARMVNSSTNYVSQVLRTMVGKNVRITDTGIVELVSA